MVAIIRDFIVRGSGTKPHSVPMVGHASGLEFHDRDRTLPEARVGNVARSVLIGHDGMGF